MKIKIINPNTSLEMTESIYKAAREAARPDTEIVAVSPAQGPISIENFHDQFIAVGGMLEEVRKGIKEKYDAFIIAAACDPGINPAREISPVPVIGIGEASLYLASLVAAKYSIITVMKRIVPLIEEVPKRAGLMDRCASIRSTNLTVLDTEHDPGRVIQELKTESRKAILEDGAEAICLGCSGMVKYVEELEKELGVPVFDGVVSAVKLAEILVDLQKKTSKVLTYQTPAAKLYKGMPTIFEFK
jgi:allantoin racemase